MTRSGKFLICLMFLAPVSTPAGAAPDNVCTARVEASLEALIQGDYDSVGTRFAPALAKQIPPAKIEQAWRSIQQAAGPYQSYGKARIPAIDGRRMVVMPIKFAHASWDALYACDAQARITALRLMPAIQLDAVIQAERREVEAEKPVKAVTRPNGVRVEPFAVSSPYGPLRGALTLPPARKRPFPAVVFLSGSGPNDMDETVGGSKPFRDIADGLAAAGIASLRYDKRQTDYPKKISKNADLTVDDEETDDALTAVRRIAQRRSIDPTRVFVLGHSEGGMLAPRIGQRASDLAGLIFMAAPARKLLAVMQQQTREQGQRQDLPHGRIQAAERALAKEQTRLESADPNNPPEGNFRGAPQSWWLSLHEYDQVAIASSLSLPMLFLQGGRDFQVSEEKDFDAWKKALVDKPDVVFRLYPGLSHLFTPAGKTMTPADYSQPAHVDAKVISDIAHWVESQSAQRLR